MTQSEESQRPAGLAGMAELHACLRAQYAGVFDEDALASYLRDYFGFGFARQVAPVVVRQTRPGGPGLDIGCGYGSFVIEARRLGMDMVGIEIEEREVEYARRRLAEERIAGDPATVFRRGDALELPFEAESFDAVTLWNVLEHVPDATRALSEARRVLRPGGAMYVICPNYAAFRREAHYGVFWPPFMPRALGARYLRWRGKVPRFFETSVFPKTSWGILFALLRLGLRIGPLGDLASRSAGLDPERRARIERPELTQDPGRRSVLSVLKRLRLSWVAVAGLWAVTGTGEIRRRLKRAGALAVLGNPFVGSVVVCARKRMP